MCITVMCDNEYCIHNRDGSCGRKVLSLSRETFSGFRNGEREWAQACGNYEEAGEDDGAD